MRIRLLYVVFLVIAWAHSSTYAQNQDIKTLTLEEVVRALDKNPTLLSFDEKINANNAYSKSARNLEPPKISAGLWMFPYSMPNGSMNEGGAENQGALMIGVEQMIMNPNKRKAEQSLMEGMSRVEQTMKSYDRQNMVEEVKKMYYEWVVLKKKLNVLKASEDILNLMIKSGEIGYTYNQNQLSRIYKAKSELYSIHNMQIMIENMIRKMNIGLNTMMNVDKDIVFNIDTTYSIKNYDNLSIDTNSLKKNRSDIQNINESLRLLELRRTMELSKKKPDFGIQYAHMNSFGSMPNQFNLMGMVTIPIAPWASRGYKANIEGIKHETKALNLRKEAIVNETIGGLENIQADISNKKRQVEMYEKNLIPALEKNFSTSLIAFEHMKEDMFMTIDAWMALKMAKIEYLDLLGELLKLQASFERQVEEQ